MKNISAQPAFTVVIPTRERCDTLFHSLSTVLRQDYAPLSVIVADNMSQDDTRAVVEGFRDSRIRYFRSDSRLSMSANWERVLEAVDDSWVTVLGDDDGLLPGALSKIAALAAATGTMAIRTSNVEYFWPGLGGRRFGELLLPRQGSHVMLDGLSCLDDVLLRRRRYTCLPIPYTGGFVHSALLQELKSRSGFLIGSMTPDVYLGVAISQIVGTFALCKFSVAVNGASVHSNGTSFMRGSGQAFAKYSGEGNIPFHPEIAVANLEECPRSVQLLVLESYLQSLNLGLPRRESSSFGTQFPLIQVDCLQKSELFVAWEQRYLKLHGIRRRGGAAHAMLRARSLLERAVAGVRRRLWMRQVVGTAESRLANVQEAVAVAQSMLETNRWRSNSV